jgi:hypothetical protein
MGIMQKSRTVVTLLLLLLTTSFWLLMYHQSYWEPHHVYQTSDALLYVGVAFTLMTLQLELAGIIVYAIATRRLSLWWLIALLWVVFLFWISAGIPLRWTRDQEHFHRVLSPSIESHG